MRARKGAAKMQAAYGCLEATAVMQQSADKGQTALMVQTFILPRSCMAQEVWDDGRSKTRCQRS
jgi:hypothetical protein